MNSDEDQVRQVIQRIQDGWNAGDGDAFAAVFADDADYVIVDGQFIKGREAIAAGHRQIFGTIYKGSHNEATIQSIRYLTDDIAAVHVRWHLKVPRGDQVQEGHAINTLVLMRNGSVEWQVSVFQNTSIAQMMDRSPMGHSLVRSQLVGHPHN